MYTVPIKTAVAAKTLIDTFEKGKVPIPTETEAKDHPELSPEELAEPGVARKLRQEYEIKNKEAAESLKSPPPINRPLRYSVSSQLSDPANPVQQNGLEDSGKTNGDAVEEHIKQEVREEVKAEIKEEIKEEIREEIKEEVKDQVQEAVEVEAKKRSDRKNVLLVGVVRDKCLFDMSILDNTMSVFEAQGNDVVVSVVDSFETDFEEEKKKLAVADLAIFYYQPLMHTAPAVLKNWFEKVLADQFTLGEKNEHEGLIKGKKCFIVVRTPTPKDSFASISSRITTKDQTGPSVLDGILRFVGFDVLESLIIFNANSLDDVEKTDAVERYKSKINGIWNENSIFS